MFVVVINLEEGESFASFDEAFRHFYQAVKDGINNGTIPTWQLLETACYITLRSNGNDQGSWSWEQAKERAFHDGILAEDGKLI